MQYSELKERQNTVPKEIERDAAKRRRRPSVDITDPVHETSLAGSGFEMQSIDDFTRFKMMRFLKSKSDATAVL